MHLPPCVARDSLLFLSLARFASCLRFITWTFARQLVTCAWGSCPRPLGYQLAVFKMCSVLCSLCWSDPNRRLPLTRHCWTCIIKTGPFTKKKQEKAPRKLSDDDVTSTDLSNEFLQFSLLSSWQQSDNVKTNKMLNLLCKRGEKSFPRNSLQEIFWLLKKHLVRVFRCGSSCL